MAVGDIPGLTLGMMAKVVKKPKLESMDLPGLGAETDERDDVSVAKLKEILDDPAPPKRKRVAYNYKGREQSSNIEDRRDEPMVVLKASNGGVKLMKAKTSKKIMRYNDRGK